MDIANGTTPDQFGVIWPRGFEVCSVCGQPDSCGDCNHVALTSPEVALIIVGETNEDSSNEPTL